MPTSTENMESCRLQRKGMTMPGPGHQLYIIYFEVRHTIKQILLKDNYRRCGIQIKELAPCTLSKGVSPGHYLTTSHAAAINDAVFTIER